MTEVVKLPELTRINGHLLAAATGTLTVNQVDGTPGPATIYGDEAATVTLSSSGVASWVQGEPDGWVAAGHTYDILDGASVVSRFEAIKATATAGLPLHPLNYAAVGDGVADDTTPIINTLTAAGVIGGTVLIDRTYRLTQGLTLPSNVTLRLAHGGELTFKGAPYDATLLNAVGTAGASVNLTADAAAGASTVTVASHALVAGDRVKLGSSAVYAPGRDPAEVGEFAVVASTTSTTITFRSPLAGGYLVADTAFVQKITLLRNVRIEGNGVIRGAGLESVQTTTLVGALTSGATSITVADATNIPSLATIKIGSEYININGKVGNVLTVYAAGEGRGAFDTTAAAHSDGDLVTIASTQRGLNLDMTEGATVQGVRFEDCFSMAIAVGDSVATTIDGISVKNSRRWNSGYGVQATSATQDLKVLNSDFEQVRHAFTTGGPTVTGRKGVTRRVLIDNNTVRDTYGNTGDALDTHAVTEDITFSNNHVYDAGGLGINIECPSAVVRGNTFVRCGNHGMYFHNEATADTEYTIEANVIRRPTGYGICVGTGGTSGSGSTVRHVVVANNRVYQPADRGIYVVSFDAAIFMRGVTITGNSVNAPGAEGIKILRVDRAAVTGNAIRDVPSGQNGIIATTSTLAAISGNSVHGASGSTVAIQGVDLDNSTIAGNAISSAFSTGITLDNASTANAVTGNTIAGTAPLSLGTGAGNVQAGNSYTPNSFSIPSAATITIPPHLDYAAITGTTTITSITASSPQRRITLRLVGVLTVTDGSNLKLNGNFVSGAGGNDTITLVCDGTSWFEVARSAN